LLELGGIGLVGYLLIYILILRDIFKATIDKSTKFFYYGLILSIAFMNFTGDVNVYGFGISQLFWLVIGFFYVFRDIGASCSSDSEFTNKKLKVYV
jgi:hypothetical protein